MDDADVLLQWRNDEETRRWSRTHGLVASADHRRWLERTLADPNSLQWVGECAAIPVGTVRYELDPRRTQAEVSLTVAQEARGRRLGARLHEFSIPLLAAAVPTLGSIVAYVHRANAASLRLFQGQGYRSDDNGRDAHGYLRMYRPIAFGGPRKPASAAR